MERKILIWHGSKRKEVNHKDFIKALIERTTKMRFCHDYCYDDELVSYLNMILEYLPQVTCIQIYQDDVIRLHLTNTHYEEPRSIFIEIPRRINKVLPFILMNLN